MPTVNLTKTGTILSVTVDGGALPNYDLSKAAPVVTVNTANTAVSFLFPDDRYINLVPFASVQIAGVAQNAAAPITSYVASMGAAGAGTTQSALAYAANIALDFNQIDLVRTLALTGNVTFDPVANKAAGKEKVVIITADGTARTLSFPAWTFQGDIAPTSIAANKTATLYLYCSGTTEASVLANYSVQS